MTKDQAREILENWINEETLIEVYNEDGGSYDGHWNITLPIVDKVIYRDSSNSEWTFKGLIKIAYDL